MTKEIDVVFCDSGCIEEFSASKGYDFCPKCGQDLAPGKAKVSSGHTIQLWQYNDNDDVTDIWEFDLNKDEEGPCCRIEQALEDSRNHRIEIKLNVPKSQGGS